MDGVGGSCGVGGGRLGSSGGCGPGDGGFGDGGVGDGSSDHGGMGGSDSRDDGGPTGFGDASSNPEIGNHAGTQGPGPDGGDYTAGSPFGGRERIGSDDDAVAEGEARQARLRDFETVQMTSAPSLAIAGIAAAPAVVGTGLSLGPVGWAGLGLAGLAAPAYGVYSAMKETPPTEGPEDGRAPSPGGQLPGRAPDGSAVEPAAGTNNTGTASRPTFAGSPGTTQVGDFQDRTYGSDGLPARDVDWDADHEGVGRPHAHDWSRDEDGRPVCGEARPATDEEVFSGANRDPETGRLGGEAFGSSR